MDGPRLTCAIIQPPEQALVGVVGLGLMGTALTERLLDPHYRLDAGDVPRYCAAARPPTSKRSDHRGPRLLRGLSAGQPALYLAEVFRVKFACFAPVFSSAQLQREFHHNYHVRHRAIFAEQRERLVLIKGGLGSRLFRKAHLVGESVRRKNGASGQLITPQMGKVFGRFGGIGSLQRGTPRWAEEKRVGKAEKFVASLA